MGTKCLGCGVDQDMRGHSESCPWLAAWRKEAATPKNTIALEPGTAWKSDKEIYGYEPIFLGDKAGAAADTATDVNRKPLEPAAVQPIGKPGGSLAPASPDTSLITPEDAKGIIRKSIDFQAGIEHRRKMAADLLTINAQDIEDRAIARRLKKMALIESLDEQSRGKVKK